MIHILRSIKLFIYYIMYRAIVHILKMLLIKEKALTKLKGHVQICKMDSWLLFHY